MTTSTQALTTPDNETVSPMDKEISLLLQDEDGNEVTKCIKFSDLAFREDLGNEKSPMITPEMILLEAKAEDSKASILERERFNFSAHFLGLARQCGNEATFAAVCAKLEESQHWGNKPKGDTSNLYHAAPKTWKSYKARIIKAFRNNPDLFLVREIEVDTVKKDGSKERKIVELARVTVLHKHSEILRKEREVASAGTAPVIEGEGDGEGKGSNTVESNDLVITGTLGSLHDLLQTCTDQKVSEAIMKTVAGLIKKARKAQPIEVSDSQVEAA